MASSAAGEVVVMTKGSPEGELPYQRKAEAWTSTWAMAGGRRLPQVALRLSGLWIVLNV